MNRTLAAWALLLAGILLSVAIGAGWLQASVFTPTDSGDDAAAILKDDEIRTSLRDLTATVTAPEMDTTEAQLGGFLDERVFSTQAGADVLAELIAKIERVVIGQSDDQVVLTGAMLVPIVRDQRAANVPDITIPVQRSGTMNTTRKILNWLIPITATLAVTIAIIGAYLRPERQEVLRVIGESLVALALSVLFFVYLIPTFVLPTLDSSVWVAMAPRLAAMSLPMVIIVAVVSAGIGLLLILWSFTGGSRRQWSTPLSANRYKSERPTWS